MRSAWREAKGEVTAPPSCREMERSRSLGTAAGAEPEGDLEDEEEELEEEEEDLWDRDVSPAPSCPAIREMRWRVDSWWSDVS